MKHCILGSGTIGTTLAKQLTKNNIEYQQFTHQDLIDHQYDLSSYEFDTCYVACVPARKWFANSHPDDDFKAIQQAAHVMKTLNCKTLILISTIDADDAFDAYGSNRKWLEVFVETDLHQIRNKYIVRLPMIIGEEVKKNFYYDCFHPAIDESKLQGVFKRRYEKLKTHFDREHILIKMQHLTDPRQSFVVYYLHSLYKDLLKIVDEKDCKSIIYHKECTAQRMIQDYCLSTPSEIELWRECWEYFQKKNDKDFDTLRNYHIDSLQKGWTVIQLK